MKKESLGVSFKLFLDSLNMKRLSSDLVLFTLVKVFEENVWWAVIYHFFSPIKLLYEKGTVRVLFKCFSDSINMKTLEFSIFGLIKQTSMDPYGTKPILPRFC
jgi:hypothetical protein